MESSIIFQDSHGNNVSAVITKASDNLNSPIVVIAHGFASNKNGSSKDIAAQLANLGAHSLRFDFYGHGDSDGKFEDVTVSKGADDVLSAINYVSALGYSNIHLIGTSYGGACSILAAAKTDKLKSLILRSPVSDYYTRELMTKSKEELFAWEKDEFRIYKSGSGKELRLNSTFLSDMKDLNGFQAARNIIIPTLIVHGNKDESVPILLSEMLVKVIGNSRLEVIEGADHRYSNPKHDEYVVNMMIEEIYKYIYL